MSSQSRFPSRSRFSAGALGVALLAAACGGGSSGPSAASQVKTSWESFFSSKTSTSQKVKLLQNGSKFGSFIAAQEKNPLASELTATVSKVVVKGNTATVTWTVQLGTQKLSPGTGQAVEVNGKWLVSQTTFCNLAQLEGKPPTGCP